MPNSEINDADVDAWLAQRRSGAPDVDAWLAKRRAGAPGEAYANLPASEKEQWDDATALTKDPGMMPPLEQHNYAVQAAGDSRLEKPLPWQEARTLDDDATKMAMAHAAGGGVAAKLGMMGEAAEAARKAEAIGLLKAAREAGTPGMFGRMDILHDAPQGLMANMAEGAGQVAGNAWDATKAAASTAAPLAWKGAKYLGDKALRGLIYREMFRH